MCIEVAVDDMIASGSEVYVKRPSAMRSQLPFRVCGGNPDGGSSWMAAEELGPLR